MVLRCLVYIFVVTLGLAAPALAAEEILQFHANLDVEANGDLIVTETIKVRSEGESIQRGIYRDLPLVNTRGGIAYRAGFDLVSIERNGKPEDYHTRSIKNGIRIYIGNESVDIDPGVHTYVLTYITTRQLRTFESYDELYWNVTGNAWRFPIAQASATVRLPKGADVLQTDAYTGPLGAKGKRFSQKTTSAGYPYFVTTGRLRPGEGLSVAVGFSKGFTKGTSTGDFLIGFLSLYRNIVVLGIGLIGALAYYFTMWLRVGRDPKKGTIIPLFHPPEGFSPAGLSHVYNTHFNTGKTSLALTAAVVNMAVKNYLRIDTSSGDTVLQRIRGTETQHAELASGEKVLAARLFDAVGGRDNIALSKRNQRRLSDAQFQFEDHVGEEYGALCFHNNRFYAYTGIAITAIAILIYLVVASDMSDMLRMIGPFFFIFGLGSAVLRPLLGKLSRSPGALWMWLLGAFAIIGLVVLYFNLADLFSLLDWSLVVAMIITNFLFYELLKAPTVFGRQVLDHIEGFKLYLETAEADRMNLVGAPDMSPALFERYLPFAVGLGVEKPWTQRFEAWAAARAEPVSYRPRWSSGSFASGAFSQELSALTDALETDFGTATEVESSGSGGRGSSGGGGGGGGGGGW